MQRSLDTPAPKTGLSRPAVNIIVCAAVMAATAWAVLAAGWAQNAAGAVVVAVAAAVEGALLARAAVHRFVALLIAPVLALAAIVPTTIGAMPFDGDTSVAHSVGRFAGAIFGGLGASTDWQFTVGLCAVLWVAGYWLAWMALREGKAVLGVLPIYAILATNVLNTKTPDTVGFPEAVAVLCTLLVLAGAHLDTLQARWERGNVRALPGTRSRFAASVAVAAIGMTLAALLIPSLTSTDVSSHFFPGNAPGTGSGGSGSGGGGAPIQFSPNTEPGGPLVSQPQPVLTYTTDSNVPVYLRLVTDVQFSGGNWFPGSTEQALSAGVAETSLVDTGGSLPRDRSPGDGGIGSDEATVTATIQLQAAGAQVPLVPFPGDPDWTDQSGSATGEVTDNAAGLGDQLLAVDSLQLPEPLTSGAVLHSRGYTSSATVSQLQAAGTDYPAFTQPYTQLSDDSTGGLETVKQLAQQWTAGLTNPYDQAVAIESHLRDPRNFTYTLKPPDTPAGVWPIVYFLTTTHKGYCQYFASSMGTMLRSLGIPTRLVVGYGPGTTLGEHTRTGATQQQVTTSDAHDWVEAYFPGYGWVPFEPTPPSSVGNYTTFPRGGQTSTTLGSTPPAVAATPGTKPGFSNGPNQDAGGAGAASKGAPVGLITLIVLGAIVVVALLLAAWMLLPRTLRGTWRRLEVLGALLGVRRRPDETYFEYARRFDHSVDTGSTASLRSMAEELSRAEFSMEPHDALQLRRVQSHWHRVLLRAPRSARRTLRRRRRRSAVSGV